jgi:hypothetical protein
MKNRGIPWIVGVLKTTAEAFIGYMVIAFILLSSDKDDWTWIDPPG